MNKSTKKIKGVSKFVITLLSFLIGILAGIVMAFRVPDLAFGEVLALMATLFLFFYVHVIIHEAGHFIAGLLTGYKLISFSVFCFCWTNEEGRVKFGISRLPGAAGQCLMSPPEIKDGKYPFVLYNAGGSLMNIIVGAIFLIPAFLTSGLLSAILFFASLAGFWSGLLNILPFQTKMICTDGFNLLSMRKNERAQMATYNAINIVNGISRGKRYRDLPSEWFNEPKDEELLNCLMAQQAVFTLSYYIDKGDFSRAREYANHIAIIDSAMHGIHRFGVGCDRLYLELIGERRSWIIDSILTDEQKHFMDGCLKNISVLRTRYAYETLFTRNAKKAKKYKDLFEKCSKKHPYRVEVEVERELMAICDKIAEDF